MNGSQQAKDAAAGQKPAAGTGASAQNGNSTLNKKRKKEGLKPIITTEGPG
jgi:serine/threonine-protein kinase SRPK3